MNIEFYGKRPDINKFLLLFKSVHVVEICLNERAEICGYGGDAIKGTVKYRPSIMLDGKESGNFQLVFPEYDGWDILFGNIVKDNLRIVFGIMDKNSDYHIQELKRRYKDVRKIYRKNHKNARRRQGT